MGGGDETFTDFCVSIIVNDTGEGVGKTLKSVLKLYPPSMLFFQRFLSFFTGLSLGQIIQLQVQGKIQPSIYSMLQQP